MAFLSQNLDDKICLTCHYYTGIGRRLIARGRLLFIEYEKTTGGCGLFRDFPKLCNCKATNSDFCHYKRWVDLP